MKTTVFLALSIWFCGETVAQQSMQKDSTDRLSPLLTSAFKKQAKPRSDLNEHFKRPNNQLMYWPNYPLTVWDISQRDQKYDRSVGQQIIGSIAESYVNYLLYGRSRKVVANIPKF